MKRIKHSAETVEKIRALHAAGQRPVDIARQFGIPHETVKNYVHGKRRLNTDLELPR